MNITTIQVLAKHYLKIVIFLIRKNQLLLLYVITLLVDIMVQLLLNLNMT